MKNELREILGQIGNLDDRNDIWFHSDVVSEFANEADKQLFVENRMQLIFLDGENLELIIEGDVCADCYWKVYSYKKYKYSEYIPVNFKRAMFVKKENGCYVMK